MKTNLTIIFLFLTFISFGQERRSERFNGVGFTFTPYEANILKNDLITLRAKNDTLNAIRLNYSELHQIHEQKELNYQRTISSLKQENVNLNSIIENNGLALSECENVLTVKNDKINVLSDELKKQKFKTGVWKAVSVAVATFAAYKIIF